MECHHLIPAVNRVRAIWHVIPSLFMKAGHVFAAFHFLPQGHTNSVRSFWFQIASVLPTSTQFTYGNETVILILVTENGMRHLWKGVGGSFLRSLRRASFSLLLYGRTGKTDRLSLDFVSVLHVLFLCLLTCFFYYACATNGCVTLLQFYYYYYHRRTHNFSWRRLTLSLYIIYVWFWKLRYEDHVKIPEPTSGTSMLQGNLKLTEEKKCLYIRELCIIFFSIPIF
jgi:hypothetical protein